MRGYYVPPFEVKPRKLIRIYIPNFSRINEPLGFDLALELIDLFSKKKAVSGLDVSLPIPYAKNYQQSFWEKNILIRNAKRYLIKKFSIIPLEADYILLRLGIESNESMSRLGFGKRKALTIKGLVTCNEAVTFDYYGISFDSIDKINYVIKQELDNRKSFIGFDNLQYMGETEPYDCFERIIVEFN